MSRLAIPFLYILQYTYIYTYIHNYVHSFAYTYETYGPVQIVLFRRGSGAISVIAFWLLFTRRVHTVFASTGFTNVYRQKLTGNLFGRIVDGNYYFIDGHARTTDLMYLPLLFIGSCFTYAI